MPLRALPCCSTRCAVVGAEAGHDSAGFQSHVPAYRIATNARRGIWCVVGFQDPYGSRVCIDEGLSQGPFHFFGDLPLPVAWACPPVSVRLLPTLSCIPEAARDCPPSATLTSAHCKRTVALTPHSRTPRASSGSQALPGNPVLSGSARNPSKKSYLFARQSLVFSIPRRSLGTRPGARCQAATINGRS